MKVSKNIENSNYSNSKPINPNKTFKKPINQSFGATGGSGYGRLWEALEALGGSGMLRDVWEALVGCGRPWKHLEAPE